jgi:hypothetical protein
MEGGAGGAVTVEEADPVAVAAVVAAVAAALAAGVVVVEAEPVAVAAVAKAALVLKKHGQISSLKQLMETGGHAKRALSSTQDTQANATCAVEPIPDRSRCDVKREAARALVMQAAVHVLIRHNRCKNLLLHSVFATAVTPWVSSLTARETRYRCPIQAQTKKRRKKRPY